MDVITNIKETSIISLTGVRRDIMSTDELDNRLNLLLSLVTPTTHHSGVQYRHVCNTDMCVYEEDFNNPYACTGRDKFYGQPLIYIEISSFNYYE